MRHCSMRSCCGKAPTQMGTDSELCLEAAGSRCRASAEIFRRRIFSPSGNTDIQNCKSLTSMRLGGSLLSNSRNLMQSDLLLPAKKRGNHKPVNIQKRKFYLEKEGSLTLAITWMRDFAGGYLGKVFLIVLCIP